MVINHGQVDTKILPDTRYQVLLPDGKPLKKKARRAQLSYDPVWRPSIADDPAAFALLPQPQWITATHFLCNAKLTRSYIGQTAVG